MGRKKKLDRLRYSLVKHPRYRVIYPKHINTGESIKGWWIKDEPNGTCTSPSPGEMNGCGWLQVFFCILFCWPCSPVPCFFSGNYDGYQIPDFGEPPSQTIIYTTTEHPYHQRVKPSAPIPIAVPLEQ